MFNSVLQRLFHFVALLLIFIFAVIYTIRIENSYVVKKNIDTYIYVLKALKEGDYN